MLRKRPAGERAPHRVRPVPGPRRPCPARWRPRRRPSAPPLRCPHRRRRRTRARDCTCGRATQAAAEPLAIVRGTSIGVSTQLRATKTAGTMAATTAGSRPPDTPTWLNPREARPECSCAPAPTAQPHSPTSLQHPQLLPELLHLAAARDDTRPAQSHTQRSNSSTVLLLEPCAWPAIQPQCNGQQPHQKSSAHLPLTPYGKDPCKPLHSHSHESESESPSASAHLPLRGPRPQLFL
jgi:hypothetical protein